MVVRIHYYGCRDGTKTEKRSTASRDADNAAQRCMAERLDRMITIADEISPQLVTADRSSVWADHYPQHM